MSHDADRALLVDAAKAAGPVAMRFFRRDPEVWDKPEGAGPVTEADLAVDRLLRDRLTQARPDYGWLSEETPDDAERLERERVFIVDPIDGTRAFMAGQVGWCVALAVAEAGRVVAAAVLFPAREELYEARAGGGARRDGAPIRCSDRRSLNGATALAGKAQLDPEHWPGGAPKLRREFRPSLAHRMCLAAEGSVDAALSFRDTWEWDIAAGSLIAAEAGCAVTDGNGERHGFNAPSAQSKGLLVAPPPLHSALMALRRPGAARR